MTDDWKKYWFSEVAVDWSSVALRVPQEISETVKEQNPLKLAGERIGIAQAYTKDELDTCIKDFVDGEEDPLKRQYREAFPSKTTSGIFFPVARFKGSDTVLDGGWIRP